MTDWIDVNDRLPDLNKPVLITFKTFSDGEHCVCIGARIDAGDDCWLWGVEKSPARLDGKYCDFDADDEVSVTHWAEITPPTERAEG